MATIDLGEILKQHQDLLVQAREQLEAAHEPQAGRLPAKLLIQAKEAQLQRIEARLEETQQAREAAIARYDATLERNRQQAKKLRKELKELQEAAKGGGHRPKGGAETPVKEVQGIGAKFAQRLEEAEIGTVGALVKLEPKRLAKILDASEGRAEIILDEAKKVLRQP
ncbi:MAG: hypothetical protein SX243_03345 [Acidobacteriota bacterium]|nr:hypothetical protein [Acidobacteriota bacterium]